MDKEFKMIQEAIEQTVASSREAKRIETSKKVLFASFSLAALLSIALIVCTLLGVECTNLAVVAGAAWAEVGADVTVYSIKAKSENRFKIVKSIVKDLSAVERFEPDHVIQIMDTITRE